jgi:HAD superfamily hydrolase (TIGR01509 family)
MLIIFDYFGVIARDDFWYVAQQSARNLNTYNDLKIASSQVNVGDIGWDEFCLRVSQDINLSLDEVKSLYDDHKIDLAVIKIIHELRTQGHKVVLLSNASAEHIRPKLIKLKINRLFDEIFVSSEMHYIKPDPRAFEFVLSEMDYDAGDSIMIDDIKDNISSAMSLGMTGVVFTSAEQCRHELTSLL